MPFNPARSVPDGERLTYVYLDERIPWAINIALATRRPLLVTGEPGTGKSSLARDVAERLGWAYVRETITSRTRVEDLVAGVDTVQRFNDAQLHRLRRAADYLRPGVLWWAFDGDSAARSLRSPHSRRTRPGAGGRLLPGAGGGAVGATDPREHPECARAGVVVLLDEIDKAEPDLPNDLLEPLDAPFALRVPHRPEPVLAANPVLVVITSNGERRLPPAFLRRCLTLHLEWDDEAAFVRFCVRVARAHLGPAGDDALYRQVAERTFALARAARAQRRRPPSTAEYLDTVRACVQYGQGPGSPLWELIEQTALRKTRTSVSSEGTDA